MHKKNIWIINQYAGSTYHGKEYRSPSIARELVKKGYEVTIISASHSHHFKNAPELDGKFTKKEIEGVTYLWVKTAYYAESKGYKRILNMFEFLFKTFFIPKDLVIKPDYIIVSSPSPLPILNGIYYKKKYAAKLIFEVRDLWPLSVIELGNVSPKNPFIKFLSFIEKTAYTKSDLVVSLLSNSKDYMMGQGMQKDKFVCLPNGIDSALLADKKQASQEILDRIDTSKFIVGYAGSINISNNLYIFIDIAKELKKYNDIRFVLLGSGSEEKNLKQYAVDKGVDNVDFIGGAKRNEVLSVLELFDICFLSTKQSPLYYYGTSLTKLPHYMAAKKPILYAIDSGNHPVSDAKCGIEVNDAEPQKISDAIVKLYSMSDEERKELGENGYRVLIQHYTFDKLTDTLIDTLERL